ncbi:VanW family protein [Lederbergia citrea]|uniref:VanW family protein n=2 Tax=Lederbergia citrea TaxID=2833581 RepID=A0A942UQ02_9BACI|nr:VanW family protein [Lederbergia citrea]MBS4179169.1 VanW family protein [Lederbergia citrea]MBS4205832.1 VanW family protein [Lederbergia citrea]MBS4224720.1 VanW family protein [Lederbergia citrea]
MNKGVISILLIGSLLGLAGCSVKASQEKELEEKLAQSQKQIEMYKKEQEKLEAEKKKEEEKPIVVDVVDPNTNEVIKTFLPKEMGVGSNDEKYKEEIEIWVKELARGSDTTDGYDQRMIPDKVGENGEIIKGSPRVILEESELLDKLFSAFANGGTVELPLHVSESGYQEEEVAQLDEVVVASYTTNFGSSADGRTKNIELSAEAINNVIVGVDDIFSFNTTVGPSDAEHGYQKAMEALNGKLVEGIGGGICQTSSTLFNAVDKLGVSYVEKHHHSLNVGYVPKGRDATVSYGGKDFRFQNTAGVPLLLKAYTNNGSLTVEVRTSKANQSQINNGNN